MNPSKAFYPTILFLASDSRISKVISQALDSAGYVVLTAHDIGGAIDFLKKCTPDLLIVRHYTESISGHDAAMHLRKICPGIPVLMLGGILDDGGLENRETLQGFEIFPKPFHAAELVEKVKEVLAKHLPRNSAARDTP
jgi:DNA-binding response OmpR family regulator